jgi:hypothetical protein
VAAVADFIQAYDQWMPLANLNNSEWTRNQWVDMFLKKIIK